MISPEHALEGVFEHKMDTKCRVSVPADWRVTAGNGYLRLLQSSSYELKVLRVLTEEEYQNMLQEVEKRDDLSFSMKKKVLGRLHSQILKTSLNPQGKLLIPKAWCEVPGLNSEEHVVLVGRGSYFEIFSPENVKDPSAVCFDGLSSAKSKGIEAVIVDEHQMTIGKTDELDGGIWIRPVGCGSGRPGLATIPRLHDLDAIGGSTRGVADQPVCREHAPGGPGDHREVGPVDEQAVTLDELDRGLEAHISEARDEHPVGVVGARLGPG